MASPLSYRPVVEQLESRELLAAGIHANVVNQNLVIDGSSANDYLSVTQSSGKLSVYGANITVDGRSVASIDVGTVSKVFLNGYAGNDTMIATSLTKDVVMVGAEGNDSLYGGSGNDLLNGGAGDDLIYGGAGNDRMISGVGTAERDTLFTGTGIDSIWRPFSPTVPIVNGAVADDIQQGDAPLCQTVAALAAAAKQGHNFANDIRSLGNNWYEVKLYGNLSTQRVYFDGWTTSVDPGASKGEFWMILMQRARLQALGIDPTRERTRTEWNTLNQQLNGRLFSIGEAIYHFTGATSTYNYISAANPQVLQTALARGNYLVAQSYASSVYVSANGIISNHAYVVTSIYLEAGVWKVRLYNPWGMDRENGGTIDSANRSAPAANDGNITLTWAQFTNSANFKGFFLAKPV